MALGNVNLTPQLIQAVRDSVDILDVAAPVTRLEKKGNRHVGLCPFHKEKTPSFSVDPERGLYYCFGCGAGGDAIKLHMVSSGDDFPAAIEALARSHGIPLPAVGGRSGQPERDLEGVLAAAAELFQEQLEKVPKARDYLAGRCIPADVLKAFGVGYAPDSFDFLVTALGSRFPRSDLEAVGLISSRERDGGRHAWDRFRDRLMFPIHNASGRLVGFGGRTLGDDKAKYINTPETARFQKRHLLYGLDQSRKSVREKSSILLVEGYFDVLAAVASGVSWVAATMGTALSAEQARLCSRYAEEVVLGYDGDEAGQQAGRRALPTLLAQGLGVRRVRLEAGTDPDSFRLAEGEEALRARVEEARDLVEEELDGILSHRGESDPRSRAQGARQVRELLSPVRDPILRFAYGRQAADRLGIPADLLWKGDGKSRQSRHAEVEDAPMPQRRDVMSLEERTLQLLLRGEVVVPALEELPPPEIFLSTACGNIYRQFLAMYVAGESPPAGRNVLAALPAEGEALDLMARILLETASYSGRPEELEEFLRQLNRRWQQSRLKKLALDIREAQRRGESAQLDVLIEEKSALTRSLHEIGSGT